MKFNLEKEGLETVLLSWQVELMRWIWRVDGEVDSRTAHAHLKASKTPMSRATTINFLNNMVDQGVLSWRDATGKGGHHKIYYLEPDEMGYRKYLARTIIKSLMYDFPEETREVIKKLAEDHMHASAYKIF